MRAYQVAEPFGLDALRRVDLPVPEPGPGEVLVRIRAVSLNYRDLLVIDGTWRPNGPRIPASDGVGEVVAVGDGVTRVAAGDRVAGIFLPGWLEGDLTPEALALPSLGGSGADGTLAEYAVFRAESVVRVPAHLSNVEAATLPLAGATAWHALTRAGVKACDTVLIQGTGGVSLFALQFATLRGATAIITSGSDEKLRRAAELGAAHGINYRRTPAWDAEALKLTAGRGVDHVVEVVGGENLDRSLNAVRMSGAIAFVGLLGGTRASVETFAFVEKNVRLHGIFTGSREMFQAMNGEIERHRLAPVIDRVFTFDQVPEALRHLQAGSHFGKICIEL
jgi:NADPH:quinone reductase-like Zn-dependent oxidoreductase